MKRVLILSVTAGQGHNNVARALSDCYARMGVQCRILDTFGYLNKLIGKSVDTGYRTSIKNFKPVYSGMYKMMSHRHMSHSEAAPARVMYHVFAGKLYRYISDFAPDVVISTHPSPGVILDILRHQGRLPQTAIGISTDFTVLPYWEECTRLDYIVTANELMNMQLMRKGFADSQILPFGIPVSMKFAESRPAAEIRAKYKLDPGRFTVLIMGSSTGYGNLTDAVRMLDAMPADIQFICVCGASEGAKREIDQMRLTKPIANFGFVDFVDELMDAADCVVTKPGGVSTSEAMAKRLPMIIINPIPGQEISNRLFLLNAGVAVSAGKLCPLDEAVYQLILFPERMENIRRNVELLRRPNAAKDLCEFTMNSCNAGGAKAEK